MRIVFASFVIAAAALSHAPARAADLSVGWASAAHAAPFVVYDYEPGIVVRTWVRPWGGRHYFPSSGKPPALGRREQLTPTPVSDKQDFHREWLSFPVDTIQQPPLILNQQHFFPHGDVAPPSTPQPSNPPSLK